MRRRAADGAGTSTALQVLIGDPDVDHCEMLRYLLDTAGYLVRVTHSAPDLIDLARKHLPDLILLEVLAPPANLAIMRALRTGPTRDIPVLVLTGWADNATQTRLRLTWASAVVVKASPIDDLLAVASHLLAETDSAVLHQRRLRRQLLALQRIARRVRPEEDTRRRLVSLINRLQEAVLLFDDDGEIVAANAAAAMVVQAVATRPLHVCAHDALVRGPGAPISEGVRWCGQLGWPEQLSSTPRFGACLATGVQGVHVAGWV